MKLQIHECQCYQAIRKPISAITQRLQQPCCSHESDALSSSNCCCYSSPSWQPTVQPQKHLRWAMATMRQLFSLSRPRSPTTPVCWAPGTKAQATAAGRASPAGCSRRHRSRVVALDLSSQGLDGTISPAIGNLTFLRSLNLSFNGLRGEIPPSIGSLRRLQ